MRAERSEAGSILKLVRAAYAQHVGPVGGRPRPMDDDYVERIDRDEVWVLKEAGDLCGVIVLEEDGACLWVDNVAVHPDAQRRGFGRLLLALAERRAAELAMDELRLFTHESMTANQALYESLGMERFQPAASLGDWAIYYRKPVGGPDPATGDE